MSNLQFIALLTPSLGSILLVVLAWLHQNSRLSDLRVDNNRQFDAVNQRLDVLTREISTLAADFRSFYGMEQKLEGRVDELSKRIA